MPEYVIVRTENGDSVPFELDDDYDGTLPAGRRWDNMADKVDETLSIVDFRGGHFDGAPQRSFPGIDGWHDGTPASLKQYFGESPAGVLRHASSAETSARNAGYSGGHVVRRRTKRVGDAPHRLRIEWATFADSPPRYDQPDLRQYQGTAGLCCQDDQARWMS